MICLSKVSLNTFFDNRNNIFNILLSLNLNCFGILGLLEHSVNSEFIILFIVFQEVFHL